MKPPESFVPLTATSVTPSPREFHVRVLTSHDHHTNGNGHANGNGNGHGSANSNGHANGNGNGNGNGAAKSNGFQSLESQRIGGLNGHGHGEKKIGEPRVTIQRDGDRVTHLRVQCSCGQIIDLACVYDPPAAA